MNVKKYFVALGLSLATICAGTSSVKAHDTDIYLNSGGGLKTEPLVMFVLDYRSNLGATVCNSGECQSLIDEGYLASQPTSFFNLIRAVMKKVLDPLSGFKVGFMLNHDNATNCAGPQGGAKCSNGAYVLHGFSSVTAGTDDENTYQTAGEDANKIALFDKLDHIPDPQGNVAHGYQGKELYFEFFRYLTGQGIYNAHNGWSDFGTTGTENIDEKVDRFANGVEADGDSLKAWLSYDTSIEANANSNPNGENYKSPLNTTNGGENCGSIFMINMMFQVSSQEDDSDTDIKKTKSQGGMATGEAASDIINLAGTSNSFTTVIKWMNDVDLADGVFGGTSNLNGKQNVTSYFLVDPTKINQTTNGYADAGGTTRALELSSDPKKLIEELSSILRQILSTSTTFVAPSVAVNVYNRAQVQKDVFIAMFQAEEKGKPLWDGNTKKFQIGELNGVLGLLDANGKDAVNPNDGRVKAEALSFWTKTDELIDPVAGIDEFVAGADGRFINRGGCGSRIPGFKKSCSPASGNKPPSCSDMGDPGMINPAGNTVDTGPRKLFTEAAGGSGALRPLNADSTTAAIPAIHTALGGSITGTCANNEVWDSSCNLIRFLRGYSHQDDGKLRDWMMADPLHSRPLALNYGNDPDNPDIRVIFGTNDGLLHMIRNTTRDPVGWTTDANGDKVPVPVEDGVEAWAFAPLWALTKTKRLKANSVSTPHLYGVDGTPVAFVQDQDGDGNIETADGDKVYLYFGLRRGGRAYFALDISDPDNPTQLWRIDATQSDYNELGQTWSTPRMGYMLYGLSNNAAPVLIFAGGYDPNKDTHGTGISPDHSPAPGGDDSMGRGIFVVNAETGDLIWKATYGTSTGKAGANHFTHAEMLDSIPSDVTAVDSDGNGLLDRVYVGDTGGGVWRVDMLSTDESEWTVNKIFEAGRHYSGSSSEDRRFFYAPDYVQAKDGSQVAYDAVVIGSGDRANPLDTTIENWYYVIRDRDIQTQGTGYSVTAVKHSELDDVTCTLNGSCTPNISGDGWRLQLKCPWQASGACGEKALSSAITLAGKVYFTTYQPASGVSTACEPDEGSGFLYIVSLDNGSAVKDLDIAQAGLESYTKLKSGGIPSEVVSIGEGKILRPDLKIDDTDDASGFKTFWFEHLFDY